MHPRRLRTALTLGILAVKWDGSVALLRSKFPIPGIAISGFGMDGDIDKSLEAGLAAHLVKPVKLEKLEAAIARALEVRPYHRALPRWAAPPRTLTSFVRVRHPAEAGC